MNDRSNEASQLAGLLGEVEELEKTRIALLKRVERVRSTLLAAGDRTAAMRASIELLYDHIADLIGEAAELAMLEGEVRDSERAIEQASNESSVIAFEADSLQDTLDENNKDLEKLSTMLVERRGKPSRGH